jgi:hypothetical protein
MKRPPLTVEAMGMLAQRGEPVARPRQLVETFAAWPPDRHYGYSDTTRAGLEAVAEVEPGWLAEMVRQVRDFSRHSSMSSEYATTGLQLLGKVKGYHPELARTAATLATRGLYNDPVRYVTALLSSASSPTLRMGLFEALTSELERKITAGDAEPLLGLALSAIAGRGEEAAHAARVVEHLAYAFPDEVLRSKGREARELARNLTEPAGSSPSRLYTGLKIIEHLGFADEGAFEAARRLASHPDGNVRYAATSALARMKVAPEMKSRIFGELLRADADTRGTAARQLLYLHDPSPTLAEPLAQAVREAPDRFIVEAAGYLVERLAQPHPALRDALVGAAGSRDLDTRREAFRALERWPVQDKRISALAEAEIRSSGFFSKEAGKLLEAQDRAPASLPKVSGGASGGGDCGVQTRRSLTDIVRGYLGR